MTSRPSPSPPHPDEPAHAAPHPDPDQAWKALGLVNDWIRHAEAKTAAALAAAGVTGGVLYNLVRDLKQPSIWLLTIASLCGVTIVVAALAAIFALVPRLTIRKRRSTTPSNDDEAPPEDPTSLLFFSHIARDYKSDAAPTYAQVLKVLTSDRERLTEQIGRQVHANAHVAQRKYRYANIAVVGLALDLTLLGVTALLAACT